MIKQKPTKPCCACGSSEWWLTPDGRYLCGRCHPNPNPGSDPVLPSDEGKYSSETLALRDRVILGNKKLNDALEQLNEIADDKEQWADEMERWHQANEKLSILCQELKYRYNYNECLYIDEKGRKTKKCLEGIGCRVCPSTRKYWEEEFDKL